MLLQKTVGDSVALLLGFGGIKLVSISTYGILMNLKAINVIVIAHFYLSEKMNAKTLFLVGVSFAGAFMIIEPDLFDRCLGLLLGRPAPPARSAAESRNSRR